ncbi:hypothetical protein J7E87_29250 [Streptomyces sp. ISL-1]|uniref:S1 family peptidase n=1 Tax=Streptomyces sp. ISL-1 TaxID=2817657 RepID=UPI001BE8DA72|nr:S1 family peptidase [Streptomyces sp. ISL-1]MBT2393395.1 hypothetical protein [Streptomyces sp. ISL-1]
MQNTRGQRFMVTAGHCFENRQVVFTESLARVYGTVSNRRTQGIDVELIGGRQYSGHIFTGGTDSSTVIPVRGAGRAYVGFGNYCTSGRTTGETCGHRATSLNGQICVDGECLQGLIVFNNGRFRQPRAGDSGGPFYVKDRPGAYIRGHYVAGNAFTGYAVPWTAVASNLRVSIVRSLR